MNDESEPASSRAGPKAWGVCALIFASFFALLTLLFVVSFFSPGRPADAASVFMPFFSFVAAHVFAFVALASKSLPNRRAAKLALRILWLSFAVLLIVGFVSDRFFTHQSK